MLDTYKAILKGNRVKWTNGSPVEVFQDQEVEVLIAFPEGINIQSDLQTQRGERMARCLEKIAGTGGVAGITDPV
jgi:hypothetical protein